ncbi:MAG TPA: ATP-dependent 6-phosphofructokinase [Anaerolineales bacterium]|jgi:6-phosphofructokinase 1|nr:ATP-dependent 6-phosphofructokinase [Anaerolineales bacterium]
MSRIGILTGGGDAPGLNAVIRAVVHTAKKEFDLEVLGLQNGFDGLVEPESVRVLSRSEVRGILSHGGTILGAANRGNPFARKMIVDGREEVRDVSAQALRNIEQLKLDSLIVVGGDGTLRISKELCDRGAPIIGIPKTIDNDMGGTDQTFGFSTAMRTATEAIDKLHTTAESHHRVMVLELMGRDAGWIALAAGISGGADVILIPEIPFDLPPVMQRFRARAKRGSYFSIMAIAEGARPKGGQQQFKIPAHGLHIPRLGGIAQQVADQIHEKAGVESRCTVLGHLQRGGTPTPFDRWLATRYGAAAVRLAAAGEHGLMVNLRGRHIGSIPLDDALAETPKLVDPAGELVTTARGMGIVFGDE